MKLVGIITLIVLIIAVLVALILLLYKHFSETLNDINTKLSNTEVEYFDKIKEKYNLIIRLIKLVENKFKIESKLFEDVKLIKQDSLSSLKNDKLLNKCYKELIQIKEDNQKNRELKSFREVIDDYEENELVIISLRTYYNKYTLLFNELIKKFPYNLIAKIKKYKIKTLLEGKELDINYNNDLEV